jgi:UDP-2,4-diacetamido-2,4,6-trideoxy-beta-L-altropyranose hydrolase
MKIIFRVDASSRIGSGHVVRCLTLAKILKKKGADCRFISRNHKNNMIEKIERMNFKVIILPRPIREKKTKNIKKNKLDYSNWLGVSWKDDATQTINVLNKEKIDWLVVDHYGIEKKWEKKLRPYIDKIMVIDDLANRKHECDLLLDQNLTANFKNRYKKLLPKNCYSFLGPEYALLQDEYKEKHLSAISRNGAIKRILVYFGNVDSNNLTEKAIKSFLKLKRKDIKLDLVINSQSLKKKKIETLSKKNTNISVKSDLTSLASLILKADIAIGACGSTSWERCCLGLPAIVITVAENQKLVAKELHKRGLINWIGHYDKINISTIYNALDNIIDHNLQTWSNTCMLVTDGCGAGKIANILYYQSVLRKKTHY